MDTASRFFYFGWILGALPAFAALSTFAVASSRGALRLLQLVPALYMAWALLDEFAPVLLHAPELESSDFYRLLYERWSALSRLAGYSMLIVVALLLLGALAGRLRRFWKRRPRRG
jgi:hypothetical protein